MIEEEKVDFEHAIRKAGGFGRFQAFASFVFTCIFITNGHTFYAIPLLVMYPKYFGCGREEGCTHLDYCEDPLKTMIDLEDDWSLNNWVGRFNLACIEPYIIGLLGTMFFAGTTATGIFITRLGDIYGRMWITRVSSLLSILVQAAIITSTNFNLNIILFFMLGVTSPGKNQVGFVYASEIT
jgi:MFS family permease